MSTVVALLRDGVKVAELGDIVKLNRKPRNLGGRGFKDARFRVSEILDHPGGSHAYVFGPLVAVDGHWLPDPTRRVRDYLVELDAIEGAT